MTSKAPLEEILEEISCEEATQEQKILDDLYTMREGMDQMLMTLQKKVDESNKPNLDPFGNLDPESFSIHVVPEEKKKSSFLEGEICISFTPKKAR